MYSEDNYFDSQRNSIDSQRNSIDSDSYFRDEESRLIKSEPEPHPRSKPKIPKEKNLTNVLHLALTLVLLFSAYNPAQNLLSVYFKQFGLDYLGLFSIMIICQCSGITSLLAPLIVSRLPYKNILTAAAVGATCLIILGKLVSGCNTDASAYFCQSYMLHRLTVSASILTGIGMGFIWLTSSVYIQECSYEANKGSVFGIFSSVYQFCNISGSLITLTLVKHVSISSFFTIQIFLSIIAVGLFQTIKKPEVTKPKKERSIQREEEPIKIQKIIHFMNREKMKSCYPIFVLYSFSSAFLVSNLSKMVGNTLQDYSPTEANLKLGYILLTLSISQISAGVICGLIFDKSRKNALEIIMQLAFATVVLNYIGYHWGSYYFFFPLAVCYGFLDSGFLTIINALIGGRFSGKYEQFAVFRFVHGMSQSLFYLLFMIFENSVPSAMFFLFIFVAYYAWDNRKSLF